MNQKIKNSLEDLNYHCEDMSVLGVFEADKIRKKIRYHIEDFKLLLI